MLEYHNEKMNMIIKCLIHVIKDECPIFLEDIGFKE